MANAVEVERVARLMHAAYRDYKASDAVEWKTRVAPWEECSEACRAAYRAVAAAVIADRAGAVSGSGTVETCQ